MKSEMRRQLARLSFEEKIRKVTELIRLSQKIKNSGDDAAFDAGDRRSCRLTNTKALESGMQEKRERFVEKSGDQN
jgi:hypothetical protein